MFLFYVCTKLFFKGETIQGGTLFKGGHYLGKYSILFGLKGSWQNGNDCDALFDLY